MGNRTLNWLRSLTRPRDKQSRTQATPATTAAPKPSHRVSVPEQTASAAPRSWKAGLGRRRSDAPSAPTPIPTPTTVLRSKAPETISSTTTSSNQPPEPLQAILSHENTRSENPSAYPYPRSLLSSSPRNSAGEDSPSVPSTPERNAPTVADSQPQTDPGNPSLPTPPPPTAALKRLRHHHSPNSRRPTRQPVSGSRLARNPSTHSQQPPPYSPAYPVGGTNNAAPLSEGAARIWSHARPPPRISASDEPSRALSLDLPDHPDAQPPSIGRIYSAPRSAPLPPATPHPGSTGLLEPATQRDIPRAHRRTLCHPGSPSTSSLSAPPSHSPSVPPSSLQSITPVAPPPSYFIPVSSGPPLRTSALTRDTPSLEQEHGRDIQTLEPYHPHDDRPSLALYNAVPVSLAAPSESGGSHDSSVCGDSNRGQSRTRYHKFFGSTGRFALFRRQSAASDGVLTDGGAAASLHAQTGTRTNPSDEMVFGTRPQEDPRREPQRPGEELLIKFIRSALGPKAENLAIGLMNKTPITATEAFSYEIHQGTEDTDLDIVRRDLMSGRLYASGLRLQGGAWCNLLLGDRFAPGSTARQRHELTYRRSMCSCLICMVKSVEVMRAAMSVANSNVRNDFNASDTDSTTTVDVVSTMRNLTRTPLHSAMANFVVLNRLPSRSALLAIGGSAMSKELEIGSVIRLNSRASAKLKFTDEVRELFKHLAYTGPISHERVVRDVTTIGVKYYMYNKGKKERKVYIQGDLIRLPLNVGVVKLGTHPMYLPEVGAMFCLYRKQIMSIYTGEIVLEGNSIGSFIKTNIRYYIGFGEERGVCPVFANKTLGNARKLGINEILLHHHMVDDLVVKCT